MLKCLLLLTLLNHGHCFSNSVTQITLVSNLSQQTQSCQLHWQLVWGDRVLSKAVQPLNQPKMTVNLQLPAVRVRTKLLWQYQLRAGDQLLTKGHRQLIVFPASAFDRPIMRFKNMSLTVITDHDALPKLLENGGINVQRVDNLNHLGLKLPNFLLIDKPLPASPINSPASQLEQLAVAGTQIILFNQLMTHLPTQQLPSNPQRQLDWQADHLLLSNLQAEDWLRNPSPDPTPWVCLNVDRNEPLLDLAGYKPESELAVKQVFIAVQKRGKGRIINWQLPLGSWDNDPRAQQALLNCLDYLHTPVSPTPSRQWRRDHAALQTPNPQPIPTIGNY